MDQNGLATKRSAGVTPEVNVGNLFPAGDKSPWLWNLGKTSPEVQNRAQQKRLISSKNFEKKSFWRLTFTFYCSYYVDIFEE